MGLIDFLKDYFFHILAVVIVGIPTVYFTWSNYQIFFE